MKNFDCKRIDWPVTLFLILTPTVALIASPLYYYFNTFSWSLIIFSVVFAAATNLSITAGYHRLFAHRSYDAHPLAKLIFLLIGSSAWQGSALKWCADHRVHHGKIDSDEDPYSINKGFWYAHMGWLFLKDSTDLNPKAPDLEKDWMVRFQHNYYVPVALIMGFGFPTLVGYFLGHPWGGLIVGGALRITLTQQSTFFVNSLCHTFGKKPYTDEISARDSFWVAVLTHGEGYHNFHHKFQIDYRNGIRWYHWDPTKWIIKSLSIAGLASKLRTISQQEILKARLQMDEFRLKSRGFSNDTILQLKEKILHTQDSLKRLKLDYEKLKTEMQDASHQKMEALKVEIKLKKIELKYSLELWKTYLNAPTAING